MSHGWPLSVASGLNRDDVRVKLFVMQRGEIIDSNPEVLGGTPVFTGTRVPVRSLFDHLEAGDSIDDFLEGFPSVRRDQVIALLEISQKRTS